MIDLFGVLRYHYCSAHVILCPNMVTVPLISEGRPTTSFSETILKTKKTLGTTLGTTPNKLFRQVAVQVPWVPEFFFLVKTEMQDNEAQRDKNKLSFF